MEAKRMISMNLTLSDDARLKYIIEYHRTKGAFTLFPEAINQSSMIRCLIQMEFSRIKCLPIGVEAVETVAECVLEDEGLLVFGDDGELEGVAGKSAEEVMKNVETLGVVGGLPRGEVFDQHGEKVPREKFRSKRMKGNSRLKKKK